MSVLWLYRLNTIFMLIIAIREARRPAKALNWLAICLILPVIGFGLYLSTTNPKHIRREKLTSPQNKSDQLPDSFSRSTSIIAKALNTYSVHGVRKGHVQILINGIETYDRLIQSIQNAQRTIDLEYYIYRDDQIGKRITDLLIERATDGVQVRFLRDGFGSRKFPRSQIVRMMDAGIECRTIFPARFPWITSNWNYRDHCKIVVIDGKEVFTGGINVGYEYTGLKPNVGFWRDTHLWMEGEVTDDLQAIFNVHWNISSAERMRTTIREKNTEKNTSEVKQSDKISPLGRSAFSRCAGDWSTELGNMDRTVVDLVPEKGSIHNAYVQTIEGNPGISTPMIREAYFICITQATKTIDITTPYFIPDADIIIALKTAVSRGVQVRLLVPRETDLSTVIVGAASRTYYGDLLEAGVQIYLYSKGMLHAKTMVIDGEIAEVGSANYDLRSHRLNYEVCEISYSLDVARELTDQFERDLMDSTQLSIEDMVQRSLSRRMIDQGARLLSPLL